MDLPIRFAGGTSAPAERLLTVDGAWGAPGLNLSHWPGHATPDDLRHELSTGSALRFARLARAERERRARGCEAIANNHYDTDGACAVFAARFPERALALERELLDAAAAGDFFAWPSDRALCVDAAVSNLADPARSPLAARFEGLDDGARHELCYHHVIERLPAWLADGPSEVRDLWEPELEDALADRTLLAASERSDDESLELTRWVVARGAAADPGRHALFGASDRDRQWVELEREGGRCYRLVIGTRSWFDLPGRARRARPDLAALARALNAIEGCDPAGELCWRSQDPASPSPELWFGRAEHERFAERCAALAPSRLSAERVRAELARALGR